MGSVEWKYLFDQSKPPSYEQIENFINCQYWHLFNHQLILDYQVEPSIEYSNCSMQPGWNLKYKKCGKSLCTLYPMQGYFIVLVVIGSKEMTEAEFMISSCSPYVLELFQKTKTFHGQKWLMLDINHQETMEDVIRLIHLRKKPKDNKRVK